MTDFELYFTTGPGLEELRRMIYGIDFANGASEIIIHIPKTDFTDLAIEAIIDHSLNS